MKSLSIIIPIYNTAKYLERCLDSVRALSYSVEVILVDDGSTDDCGQICDRYVASDARFRVLHKQNEGLVETRKRGINEVKSKYFSFLDSDDHIDSFEYDEMLKEIFKIEHEDSDIICVGMVEEYMGRQYKKINQFPDGVYTSKKLNELCKSMLSMGEFFNFGILPNAVCKIYNTDFVKKNPVFVSSNIVIGEDADMTYQLMLKAQRVQILNRIPYHYCRREDSMMWKKVLPESIDSLEQDLRNAFVNSHYEKNVLLNQLKDYMDFISLLCDPKRVLKNDPFFASKTDRIALYGAGGVGRAVRYGMKNTFSMWVDKNYEVYDNDEIVSIEKLISEADSYDKIFIAISNIDTCLSIKQSLIGMGVNKPIYYYRCR